MEKLTIKQKIADFYWRYEDDIFALKKDIDEAISKGATKVEFSLYNEYDCPTMEVYSYTYREETDAEFELRSDLEDIQKKREEIRELTQLEVLMKKYGKK